MSDDAIGVARTDAAPQPASFRASERYRWYVVWLLFVVYVLNFVDRQILTVLIEPIREEFHFSDTQLGLLGGLAFAVLYSTLGVPIARLADRRNRVNIIAVSLFAWSLFTVLTGRAQNFLQLLLARVAVGVGEAGCTPPAHSLISDYFERQRRTTAIAIYTMGVYGGVFVGYLVGALIAEAYGWRAAFYAVGAPGVALAVLVKMTLREPPRGFSEGAAVATAPPPVRQALGALMANATFRRLALAAALHSFVGYGVNGFHPSFLIRSHGLSVAQAGVVLSIVSALSGVGGTWFGGYLADRLSNRRGDVRWQLWVPGVATLLNAPIALLAYTLADTDVVIAMLFVSLMFGVMYLGPTFATMQRLVGPRERALGSALLLLVVNLVGLGLGPSLVGVTSDLINEIFLADGLDAQIAKAQGLRWALIIMVCINVGSFAYYMLAARTLVRDTVH
ncbi:MAG: MFS transporter [Steroidobacteraceae bacterium]|jgi:MFS family permease|nr:MFS transporter [Steroidobacteraceae bacterium]